MHKAQMDTLNILMFHNIMSVKDISVILSTSLQENNWHLPEHSQSTNDEGILQEIGKG
jgi:hypothetical protein